MGKKGDALNRLETDLNDLKTSINHQFSVIHERFSTVEKLLHKLTETQTRSPPPGVTVSTPDFTREKEGCISLVENNITALASAKRKTNKKVKTTNWTSLKGDKHENNVGARGLDSAAKVGEATAVRDELIKAILLLKTPDDLVEFESVLRSIKMRSL